jgi:hypothetical protein
MEQRFLETMDGGQSLPTVQEKEPSLLNIIAQVASNPNGNVDALAKLIDLQERVMKNEAKQEFMKDFAKMQPDIPLILHNKSAHKGTYSSYEEINEIVKPIMVKHGFSISFQTNETNITCLLMHICGHTETSLLPIETSEIKSTDNKMETRQAAISRGRRYLLMSILNISTKGEHKVEDENKRRITSFQAALLAKDLQDLSTEKQISFAAKYGDPKELTKGQFSIVASYLKSLKNGEVE